MNELEQAASHIIRLNPELAVNKPVIIKELIHYDVFFLMQQKNLHVEDMAFIGDTCLRLCHKSRRLSEDLDFHAGVDFRPAKFEKMRGALEEHLAMKYGGGVEVKNPHPIKPQSHHKLGNVNTWKIIINTSPERPDLTAQKIHIDIAASPTYSAKQRFIKPRYSTLPEGSQMMLTNAISAEEILTDKLIAIPDRNNIKGRDLWDVVWLTNMNINPDFDMLNKKINFRGMSDYQERVESTLEAIEAYLQTESFGNEMKRFLDKTTFESTAKVDGFNELVFETVTKRLNEAKTHVPNNAPSSSPSPDQKGYLSMLAKDDTMPCCVSFHLQ